ncbi:unnamed protein product, partial [Callosobruchus maculatus]
MGLRKCSVCNMVCNERMFKLVGVSILASGVDVSLPAICFRFPKDSGTKNMWLEALNMSRRDIFASSVVCENHFRSQDVLKLAGKYHLRGDAVPSLHINKPGSSATVTAEHSITITSDSEETVTAENSSEDSEATLTASEASSCSPMRAADEIG